MTHTQTTAIARYGRKPSSFDPHTRTCVAYMYYVLYGFTTIIDGTWRWNTLISTFSNRLVSSNQKDFYFFGRRTTVGSFAHRCRVYISRGVRLVRIVYLVTFCSATPLHWHSSFVVFDLLDLVSAPQQCPHLPNSFGLLSASISSLFLILLVPLEHVQLRSCTWPAGMFLQL